MQRLALIAATTVVLAALWLMTSFMVSVAIAGLVLGVEHESESYKWLLVLFPMLVAGVPVILFVDRWLWKRLH